MGDGVPVFLCTFLLLLLLLLVDGCWLIVVGCRLLLVVGLCCWLLVVGRLFVWLSGWLGKVGWHLVVLTVLGSAAAVALPVRARC